MRAGGEAAGGRSCWRRIIWRGTCAGGGRRRAGATRSMGLGRWGLFLVVAGRDLLGAMAENGGCSPRDEEGSFRDGDPGAELVRGRRGRRPVRA
jgi:hypothetical protein